jgi:hypothetical protein
MRRSLLVALAICLVASMAHAQTLILPASPGAFKKVIVDWGDHTVELREPPEYTGVPPYTDGAGSRFGFTGDIDNGLVVVGAPAAWWDGIAFLYDANTGETLHWLEAGEDLDGGIGRPQFGSAVDLANGYVGVVGPQAGVNFTFQGKGVAIFYDAARGTKIKSIWGELPGWYIDDVEISGSTAMLTYRSHNNSGATQQLSYQLPALIPEPATACLAVLGLSVFSRSRRISA